jgi:hypothetical protein
MFENGFGKTKVRWGYAQDDINGRRYFQIVKIGLVVRLSILFLGKLSINLGDHRIISTKID